MKTTKNTCPKCGAKMGSQSQYTLRCGSISATSPGIVSGFAQSQLCKERVKVARLKRKVERLTAALDTETRAVDQLRRELECKQKSFKAGDSNEL